VERPRAIAKEPPFIGLALGGDASCGWHTDATATCWGLGIGKEFDYGGAVDGTTDGNIKKPARVSGLSGVRKLSVSSTHACALVADGGVLCWGFGDKGQLGTGASGERYALLRPKQVTALAKAIDVAVGEGFTCAASVDGSVSCWGDNEWGQLGVGDRKARAAPVAVAGLSSVWAVAAGSGHVCALSKDDAIFCWGKNLSGQVGDGTAGFKATRAEPTSVRRTSRPSTG
jgi:alpha-tubulin suppressor-like RCC1 family protein